MECESSGEVLPFITSPQILQHMTSLLKHLRCLPTAHRRQCNVINRALRDTYKLTPRNISNFIS